MISKNLYNELKELAQKDNIKYLLVGAFIIKDNSILIIRRSKSENFLAEIDEIPSGHVEEDETILQALLRETKEETNLDIINVIDYIDYFDYLSHSGDWKRQLNFLVNVNSYNIQLNPKEHSNFRWVSEHDILKDNLNFTPEMMKCLKNMFDKI